MRNTSESMLFFSWYLHNTAFSCNCKNNESVYTQPQIIWNLVNKTSDQIKISFSPHKMLFHWALVFTI